MLSEEEIQVQINLRVVVSFPSGQPLPLPSRLRVRLLDVKTNRDTCRTSMNKGMGIFLEVTFSSSCHTPRPLPFPVSQSCSPKFNDQRGAVGSSQDVPAVMVELGSSSTPSSIFSCAMSVLRQKILLSSMISRFSGIRTGQLGEEMM